MTGRSPLERVLRPVLIVICLLLVVTVTFQIVARYVFAAPPVWTTEGSTLLLVFLTFLGGALAADRGDNFRITTFRDRYVGTAAGRWLWRAIRAVEIALVVLLAGLGVVMVLDLWQQNAVTLRISVGWLAVAVPLGLAALAIALVRAARRPAPARPAPEHEMTG